MLDGDRREVDEIEGSGRGHFMWGPDSHTEACGFYSKSCGKPEGSFKPDQMDFSFKTIPL